MGKDRMGVFEGQQKHQICSIMWADNSWIMFHSKSAPEQMLRDPVQEAEKWDLAPKRQVKKWNSTCDSEKIDLSFETKTGRHRFLFEEKFKILGCTMNRQGKTQRMQCAKVAVHESRWNEKRPAQPHKEQT